MTTLRDKLLDITRRIDVEMKKRLESATTLLNTILNADDIEKAIEKNAESIDEFFTQAVQIEFEKAHQENDLSRLEKIQQVSAVLAKLSTPPAEVELIQSLLDARDEAERTKILTDHVTEVNDQFLQTINSIIVEGEARKQSPELLVELHAIYKLALRVNMQKNLKG